MRIGAIIDGVDAADAVHKGTLCESLGYESVWFTDHLHDNGGVKIDPWTTIAAIASRTYRINMGTAVTDPLRVHPAKIANIAGTLNQISHGRIRLGIGAGEAMNLIPFGLPFGTPIERTKRLKEAIQIIRSLWGSTRTKPVNFRGDFYSLDNAWLDLEINKLIPIYVGAIGGRLSLEIAGKYGDGWISWLNSIDSFRKRLRKIKDAYIKAGREDFSKFQIISWIYTTITEDEKELSQALRRAKKTLLLESQILKGSGWKLPDKIVPYQNMIVTDEGDQAVQDLEDSVPDSFARECISAGSPRAVIEDIEKFKESGATDIIAVLPQNDDSFTEYAQKILVHFK